MKSLFLFVMVALSTVIVLQPNTVMGKSDQSKTFTIKVDVPVNGTIKLNPALPADGKYAEGTVITISTTPDAGYAFDAGYYSAPGRWGAMYYESMTPIFKVVVDQDKSIGASFIEAERVKGFKVTQDVVYAQPGVKKLKVRCIFTRWG